MEEQVVSIWAGTNGELDEVPIEDIRRFEAELLDYIKRTDAGLLETIRETGKFEDDTVTKLKDLIAKFKKGFETTSHGLLLQEETVEAIDADDVEQEKITRVRKK
jgi:F-type H+-transporting ATPase subunit alpha